MNYNDAVAQQQAFLNQAMQNAQHTQLAAIAIWLACFIFSCFVIYLFYARLRDIANELMKFRIAFEFAHSSEKRATPRREPEPASPTATDALRAMATEAKYLPK